MLESAPKIKLNLNLLFPQGIPQKIHVKFLKWLLTFGRYIAVVVEILVLATFAARFKFDSDLVHLKEEINKHIPFIESLATQEVLIRETQFKIDVGKKTYNLNPNISLIVTTVASLTPTGIRISSMHFDNNSGKVNLPFRLAGKTNSNNDLAVFLSNLKNDSTFTNIDLVGLTFEQGEMNFSITGNVK
ncbi:PilN domain-containing protein [Candidatus Daviesbacteria bacterium]|nr:PilN domain-containing protein [Candidatus Daviesbacteria bacterium]